MTMGTYRLITTLYRHWAYPASPIYKADQRYGAPWRTFSVERWFWVMVRIGLAFGSVTLLIIALRVISDSALTWSLSTLLIQFSCLGAGGLFLSALAVMTFFWPLAVAVLSSETIVREREKRTWAALLTTPLDWTDLLTAKLASALHWLNRPSEILVWLQGVYLILCFVLVLAQSGKVTDFTASWVMIVLSVLAAIQFGVARLQDYSTATLIGLATSLYAESRQSASVLAMLIGLIMLLSRFMLTAVLIALAQFNPAPPPQGLLILLATGPTTTIALGFSKEPGFAFILLLLIPTVRELLIQRAYRYIVAHLGEAAGNG